MAPNHPAIRRRPLALVYHSHTAAVQHDDTSRRRLALRPGPSKRSGEGISSTRAYGSSLGAFAAGATKSSTLLKYHHVTGSTVESAQGSLIPGAERRFRQRSAEIVLVPEIHRRPCSIANRAEWLDSIYLEQPRSNVQPRAAYGGRSPG